MALGVFTIHAGDFDPKGPNQFVAKNLFGPDRLELKVPGKFSRESVPLSRIEELEQASEEAVTRVGGAVGWGTAGAVLFGPAGLIAGALLGGKGKDVTFICKLKDGRKFLATAPEKIFNTLRTSLMAASFAPAAQAGHATPEGKAWTVRRIAGLVTLGGLALTVGIAIVFRNSEGNAAGIASLGAMAFILGLPVYLFCVFRDFVRRRQSA